GRRGRAHPREREGQLQRRHRAHPGPARPGPARAPLGPDRAAAHGPRGGGTMSRLPAGEAQAAQRRRGGIARSVLRGAGIILLVTVFARIAGFVRYLVFGASVGAGDVGTAYTTTNMLPNVLFEVAAGGVLAAVVVPLIAGLGPEWDPDDHVVSEETLDPRQVEDLRSPTAAPGTADGAALADRIISVLLTWT